MFTGSLRSNLDPFQEHDDATLWSVLHQVNSSTFTRYVDAIGQVHLASAVGSLREGLLTEMREGGGVDQLTNHRLSLSKSRVKPVSKYLVLNHIDAGRQW